MDDARDHLHGAWRVVSYDDRPSVDEPWSPSYGADLDGLIIYDPSGSLSVIVLGDGRFDSYFGRFEIVEALAEGSSVVGIVNHRIAASSIPELLTIDQRRPFRVNVDTLVLGDEETWRRICQRVSSNAALDSGS